MSRPFKHLERLGEEIAEVSARFDAATFQQLQLIQEFDEEGGWGHQGALTRAHWLSWRVGLDQGTAREKVRVARAMKLPREPRAGGLRPMDLGLKVSILCERYSRRVPALHCA